MGELALYRKYRSASFDAVIGQAHIVETLKNAIASGRLSHAYLFTGPRGVGKTTVARLLARAANCSQPNPSNRPCGKCENCKVEIRSHLDLIEIDAASNRGIDDARALREKITSAPSLGRYKVYIIDEVHMLTTEAFNALLKTLEEPPEHALFILATTEAHKLPETIVSRTQRFNFKPIGQTSMIEHLRYIAKNEKIDIDDGALALIAHASRGGFRDAISLLDQAAASGSKTLTAALIRRLLGQSDPEVLSNIVTAVTERNLVAALSGVDTALAEGVQAGQLANQLLEHWRTRLHELAADKSAKAGKLDRVAEAIEAILPVLKSNWPELSLEVALVRLTEGGKPEPPQASTVSAKSDAENVVKNELEQREEGQGAVSAAPAQKEAKPEASSAKPEPKSRTSGLGQGEQELWLKTLSQIKQRNNSLYALLQSSVNVHFEPDRLVLGCRFNFHRDRLAEQKNIQIIEQALARVYGRKFKVVPQLETKAPVTTPPVQSDNELVSSALEILGGEVIHE